MNFYFQVLTLKQSSDAIGLLSFLKLFAPTGPVSGVAKVSGGGNTVMFKFASVQELILSAVRKRFNEMEMRFRPASDAVWGGGARVLAVTGIFTPAASSELWFAAKHWPPGGDGSVRSRKMNAKSREGALKYYKVREAPTILELVFEVETKRAQDSVLWLLAKRFVSEVPPDLAATRPCGCCDVGDTDYVVGFETHVLMTEDIRIMARLLPPGYPFLGKNIDQLHPLIFGSKELCSGIGRALKRDAKLFPPLCNGSLTALLVRKSCDVAAATPRAKRWLLLEKGFAA